MRDNHTPRPPYTADDLFPILHRLAGIDHLNFDEPWDEDVQPVPLSLGFIERVVAGLPTQPGEDK